MNRVDDLNLKSLLEHANIGVVIHRWDTSVAYANPAALRLLRLSTGQLVGTTAPDPMWSFIDDGNRALAPEDYPVNKVKRFNAPLTNEVIGVVDSTCKSVNWFVVNAYPELTHPKDESFIVVTFNDISDQKHIFSFREIVKNSEDIVIVTEGANIDDPLGPKIVYVNKAFEKLTGYTEAEVIGETPRILQGKDTNSSTLAQIRAALQARESITATVLNYGKNGRPYWLEMSIFPMFNRYKELTHFAAIERDVTERIYYREQLERRNEELKQLKSTLEIVIARQTDELRRANLRLEQLAYRDELTGVPNRRWFLEQIEAQMRRASRAHHVVATGIVDIDHFKRVNDDFGHEAGDQALRLVATGLASFFRQEDLFARYGGEEFAFAIVMPAASDVPAVCERMRAHVESLNLLLGQDMPHRLTVSIGVSVLAPDLPARVSAEIIAADTALYEAKRSGRNCVRVLPVESPE